MTDDRLDPQRDRGPDVGDGDERDELFTSLQSIARTITAEDRAVDPPPPGLWDRIAAEALSPELDDLPTEPAAPPVDLNAARTRRRPGGTWIFAAAAAVVVVVLLGVWALVATDDEVVGSAELAALGEQGSGSAQLVDHDGTLRLEVELDDVDAGEDGYLELWMIQSTEPLRLVSLGPVRDDGTYDLPPGLDPADFPVVDVSVEHFDGDSTHSGNSVVRGELELT